MKYITTLNGKAVFEKNGKLLTAAYAMKSSTVAVTPSRIAAECEALRNTAR